MTCRSGGRGGRNEKTINRLGYYSIREKNLQKDNNQLAVYAVQLHSKTGTKMAPTWQYYEK